ncbi:MULTISPECIES: ABC transporter substrate-binding protein [unclassified Colwellia]|uniref:substrate-binding periplasmic protein n=1 Tax=unclassified Colwellia TaxID=196834 RepID=UPI0015F491AB|nr:MULTISPECIES: transporter substrate-binding domain-containing protein [unclassified Colwellia]MBA6355089.1 transporter substrate-binding domain-containing protein [Colwellia sp. BRX8-3]MBA6359765.1 transporter substrate-binding domain-containing protein [Colwellia sp. BRX8-6]MBA6366991.1 transporter substrate-binding domain-containing protein [Colwellia sp. BRX8-5]MBA6375456.1 transporter substrate-binding domain-containing protein [Colwellia sp. BRX8-2]MBA6380568.1 transporter substrate-bi
MFNKVIKIILILSFSTPAFSDTVHLTSLTWPPYSGKALNEQGASVAVAKAAFKAMGHELKVDFFPWSRAVKLASEPDSKYAGYFPEYYYESNEFSFSNPMGKGPLGLIENKKKPIAWTAVKDLTQYKIGVVQDYVNTAEVDALITSGEIKAQTATSDETNIRKVAGGRIDAAVIDTNVFSYLLANSKDLEKAQEQVQMNAKLLTEKELFVAFKKSTEGEKWLAIYNEGLKKIDITAVMKKYLNE